MPIPSNFRLPELPPPENLAENVAILKQAARAHRFLAELKGVSGIIPNKEILINTLSLQEAKDSSAIENIVTTHDELFQSASTGTSEAIGAAKEVQRYAEAMRAGFERVLQHGLLTGGHIKEIQRTLEGNKAGYRKLPGTRLLNEQTQEVVYTPPQNPADIERLMKNLEQFINDDDMYEADPLVKMAIAHYQFESIHPFYDGNGRTGRIINILYLVRTGLLDIPVLYLSRYIIRNKSDYYRLLQGVRERGEWVAWVLYMLTGVEETARQTIALVHGIADAMLDYKQRIRSGHRFYSQDLLNNLFNHPYTRIEFVVRDLGVSRLTAAKYLDALTAAGFLEKVKRRTSNYYMNIALMRLLTA